MTDELRKSFHADLEQIRQSIVRMAARVSEAIPRGTEALLSSDLQEAQRLIEEDDILDAMSHELEERCFQVLALQQPMASDLRAITTAIWLNSEIERSGDLMTNIAKATRRIYGIEIDPKVRGLLVQMSEEAARLFRLAIDAYVEGDGGLALALDDIDDRLDDLNADTVQAILETHNGRELDLQPAVQLALVCRYYERIGDHAVNIGERVHFMVAGSMPEHDLHLRQPTSQAAHRPAAEDPDAG